LEDYRLDYLVDLYHRRKLKKYLDIVVERAERQIEELLKAGRNRGMAEEEVSGILLAPPRDYEPKWNKALLNQIEEIENSLKR